MSFLINPYAFLAAGPVIIDWTWDSANDNGHATVTVDNPDGTPLRITWPDASTSDYGSGPTLNVSPPVSLGLGDELSISIAASDGSGGFGPSTPYTTPYYPFALFTASGTYTPPAWSISADVYLIGGGGGGGGGSAGSRAGGGGGAGAYIVSENVPTTAPVSVVVGAGGVQGATPTGTAPGTNGSNGGDSAFGAITASGGGYGAIQYTTGGSGACGGGGGGAGGGGGSATVGFPGGACPSGSSGAGGGGMGSAGGDATFSFSAGGSVQGSGGAGISSTILGQVVCVGGGGADDNVIAGTTVNTPGSGGGGGAKAGSTGVQATPGKAGIVLVRAIPQ